MAYKRLCMTGRCACAREAPVNGVNELGLAKVCARKARRMTKAERDERVWSCRSIAASLGQTPEAVRRRALEKFPEKFESGGSLFFSNDEFKELAEGNPNYRNDSTNEVIKAYNRLDESETRLRSGQIEQRSVETAQEIVDQTFEETNPREPKEFKDLYKLATLVKKNRSEALKLAEKMGPAKSISQTAFGSYEEKMALARAYLAAEVGVSDVALRNAISGHSKTYMSELTGRIQRAFKIKPDEAQEYAMRVLVKTKKNGGLAKSNNIAGQLAYGKGLSFPLKSSVLNEILNDRKAAKGDEDLTSSLDEMMSKGFQV